MTAGSRRRAALGSAVFFLLAPGAVVGLMPWWLTGYRMAPAPVWLVGLRVGVGALVLGAGLLLLVRAFVRFVREGRGTPAPIAPTEVLVIGGEYRYVRNPMYVAVVACVLGQAAVLGSLALVGYAVAIWLAMAAFVRWYEEPTLQARYGSRYEEYRRAVPAWIPRLTRWTSGVLAGDPRATGGGQFALALQRSTHNRCDLVKRGKPWLSTPPHPQRRPRRRPVGAAGTGS